MNLVIQEKERALRQGLWTKHPPPPDAVQNFADGLRAALGLKPLQRHDVHWEIEQRAPVSSTRRTPRTPIEPLEDIPAPALAPYVLVNAYGEVIDQRRGNARVVKAAYRSLECARRGKHRWGGRVWNRCTSRFEASS